MRIIQSRWRKPLSGDVVLTAEHPAREDKGELRPIIYVVVFAATRGLRADGGFETGTLKLLKLLRNTNGLGLKKRFEQ